VLTGWWESPQERVALCKAHAEVLVGVAEYAAASEQLRAGLRVDLLASTPPRVQAELRLHLGVCLRLEGEREGHRERGEGGDDEQRTAALQCFVDAAELMEQAAQE
jgi:hypothetical protein